MNARLCVLLTVLSAAASARDVPPDQAQRVAAMFYAGRSCQPLTGKRLDAAITEELTVRTSSTPLYYVFNTGSNNGFVIVAGQDNAGPVLGYSLEGRFSGVDYPPALAGLLQSYQAAILAARERNAPARAEVAALWKRYASAPAFPSSAAGVGPLLTTRWGQGCYYNAYCPADSAVAGSLCGHTPTGCVATAMAQVMKYHGSPSRGTGSHGYTDAVYGTLSADFGSTAYDWAGMADTADSSTYTAIALLMYHCGVSLDTRYRQTAAAASSTDARSRLAGYFGYSSCMQFLLRNDLQDSVWTRLLREELDARRPVFYRASGHAFVCDGYQDSGFFHFNWGWGGAYDGFYSLSGLTPDGLDLTGGQCALVGIQPSTGRCSGVTVLRARNSAFDDGSGAAPYAGNTDCRWLIQPDGATSIALTFEAFAVQPSDSLNVYDGPDTTASLLGGYTGFALPRPVRSSGGALLLRFTTHDTAAAEGWTVAYNSTLPGLGCSGLTALTDAQGELSDGSGAADYEDFADCRWLIEPDSARSVTLTFDSFNTEEGADHVSVYDGYAASAPLLGSFSGSTLPPAVTSFGGTMLVRFTSDEGGSRGGWSAHYASAAAVMSRPGGSRTLSVQITRRGTRVVISLSGPHEPADVSVYNLAGRAVAGFAKVPGDHVTWDAAVCGSGTYVVEAVAGRERCVRSVALSR